MSEIRPQHIGQIHRKIKMPKFSAWMVYGGVFVAIIAVVAFGYQAPQQINNDTTASANTAQLPEATPIVVDGVSVDKLLATDIASNIAEQTNMAISGNVAERAASLAVENDLAQTDSSAIVKPQIIQPTAGSREIITYTVKSGDSVKSIANAYGVSAETIRWANNLSTNSVKAGTKLRIPPVDGVLYTVKAGDTVAELAKKYDAEKARIISFNDLEISGLQNGMKIIIPGGSKPAAPAPTTATGTGIFSPSVPQAHYGGNGYAYGYCTYYAAARRAALGKPIPSNWGNASSWAYFAAAQGFTVSSTPRVGAIMQTGGGYGGLGHVAIVEEVHSDGMITISEMNGYRFGGGWNRVGQGKIPSAGYSYIY